MFGGRDKDDDSGPPRARSRFSRVLPLAIFACLAFASRGADAGYSSITIDAETGQVLNEMNADAVNYPASLTKMMTLYLAFEALETGRFTLGTPLKVSARAARQSPSKLGLSAGDTVTVEEAILGAATKSANDAAVVLAEALAGTEADFARRMTEKARALGMASTVFRNASGLPHKAQVTTARDMATLGRALVRDFPQHYHYFGTSEFAFQGQVFENHNKLLKSYPGADGIKTGYIRASGFNLVASAERNGRRVIGVILGGRSPASRNARMASLLDDAFRAQARETAVAEAAPAPGGAEPKAQGSAKTLAAGTGRGFGIQVGAFSQFAPAKLAATRAKRGAPRLLGRSEVSIEPLAEASGTVYRARLMGLTEDRARRACAVLASKNMECVTVAAEGGTSLATTEEGDASQP